MSLARTRCTRRSTILADALLGVSATVSTYVADRTDIRAGISAWVQAVQTVFEFRGVPEPTAFLATPAEAKLVREFMRSGATLGETFYGPVSFDEYGQNRARANDAAGVTFRHRRDRLPERASDGGYRSPVARILRLRRLFLQEARDTKLLSVRRGMLAMSRQLVVRLHVSAEHVPG